jgi:UrcA family protein
MFARVGAAALAALITTTLVPGVATAAMDETLVEANVVRPSTMVSYADLDLTNATGVAELNARVKRAARSICVANGHRDLARIVSENACRDTALDHARPQIAAAIERAGSTQLATHEAAITVAMP